MPNPNLIPLFLQMDCCATREERDSNLDATLKRGYTKINESLNKYSGEIAIVGSAPSLEKTHTDLKGDVMAINHALKYLLEKGIVPKFAMFWDAAEVVAEFAVPHPDITYLVAARCHPKVFERLEGCKQLVWHAGGDHDIMDYLIKHKLQDEPVINGGSTGITRGLYLGFALGYRAFNIYGGDGSYSEDMRTHVNGSLVPEKVFKAWIGDKEGKSKMFITTPEWCGQIEEYKVIHTMYALLGCKIEVYGDGMLLHMHRLLVNQHEERKAANSTT